MNAWWCMHEGEVSRDIGHDLFMFFLYAPHLAVLRCVILVSLHFCFPGGCMSSCSSPVVASFSSLTFICPGCHVFSFLQCP